MEKIKAITEDKLKENRDRLLAMFPSAMTEIVKEIDGKKVPMKVINTDKLKELVGEVADSTDEIFQFTWAGKREAERLATLPTSMALRPCKEDSVGKDGTAGKFDSRNLYIEGDNLDVLKLLEQAYTGQIKMIYIDPPYNTGKDFIYKDNFKQNQQQWIEESNEFDNDGNALYKNTGGDGRYHTNWLNMMYPRLIVAQKLLADDGVIFISVDDNEQDNLKKLCNEIFGEENYLTTFNVQVRYGEKSINEEKTFKPLIEYIFAYAKDSKKFIPNQATENYDLDKFSYKIEELGKGEEFYIGSQKVEVFKNGTWKINKNEKGNIDLLKETWISGSVYTTMSYGQVFQKVVEPRVETDGLGCLYKVYGRGEDGLGYRYYTGPQREGSTRGKMYSGVPLERVNEIKSGNAPQRKIPIQNFYDFSADFGNIRHEGDMPFSSGKKPVKLLKQLINYHTNKNFIIMDFFSGSASTAHAAMQQNADDGGNRKYIMVQIAL